MSLTGISQVMASVRGLADLTGRGKSLGHPPRGHPLVINVRREPVLPATSAVIADAIVENESSRVRAYVPSRCSPGILRVHPSTAVNQPFIRDVAIFCFIHDADLASALGDRLTAQQSNEPLVVDALQLFQRFFNRHRQRRPTRGCRPFGRPK